MYWWEAHLTWYRKLSLWMTSAPTVSRASFHCHTHTLESSEWWQSVSCVCMCSYLNFEDTLAVEVLVNIAHSLYISELRLIRSCCCYGEETNGTIRSVALLLLMLWSVKERRDFFLYRDHVLSSSGTLCSPFFGMRNTCTSQNTHADNEIRPLCCCQRCFKCSSLRFLN